MFVLYVRQEAGHTLQNQGLILVSTVGICVSVILKMGQGPNCPHY